MSGAASAENSPADSYCTPVSSQASTPLSRDAASPFPADDHVTSPPTAFTLAPELLECKFED